MKKQWVAVYLCGNCEQSLTETEKTRSNGVCPYCGQNTNSTVCNTTKKVGRWITDYKPTFWQWLTGKRSTGHWEFKE